MGKSYDKKQITSQITNFIGKQPHPYDKTNLTTKAKMMGHIAPTKANINDTIDDRLNKAKAARWLVKKTLLPT